MTPQDLVLMLEQQIQMWEQIGNPALLARFVLRNGVPMSGGALPFDVQKMESKQCFHNAARLVLDSDFEYYEGYAVHKVAFPVHHAWCVDTGGNVIDATWSHPHEAVYVGVHIPRSDLLAELARNGVWGVLDTGIYNFDYMFKRDPELEGIVKAFRR